jgi:hypothetical protein
VDVFEDADGNYHVTDPRETIELSLVLEGELPQESHQFTRKVINAWEEILNEFKIPFRSIFPPVEKSPEA